MKKLLFALCLFYIHVVEAQNVLEPKEFLGYELGSRFTQHYKVVDYFRHVADVAATVELKQYGETYEHRPLIYAVISSVDNLRNLEQIRTDNLRRTGLQEGTPSATKKAIIWLSYNVHGNEASSLEASMLTLYALANSQNAKIQEWLKNTIVILDPCINPDGRDRYANFYTQYFNTTPNEDYDAKEHHEPWPGGRPNHYLFDLNRDWAWATQRETQFRLKAYHEWMPHVHVDFHEQGFKKRMPIFYKNRHSLSLLQITILLRDSFCISYHFHKGMVRFFQLQYPYGLAAEAHAHAYHPFEQHQLNL